MSRRHKRKPEAIEGLYFAIPVGVLDSPAFQGATHQARSLLFELMRQHNGENNGRLQLTASWLSKRGWKAGDVVRRARDNLLDRRLIVLTRKGGRTIGADWFALTWYDISSYAGLDIHRGEYRKNAYRLIDTAMAARGAKRRAPKRNAGDVCQRSPALSNSVVPPHPALSNSAILALLGRIPALSNSVDVNCHWGGRKRGRGAAALACAPDEALAARYGS